MPSVTEMRRTKSDSDVTSTSRWSPKHWASIITNNNNSVQILPRPVFLGSIVDMSAVKGPHMQDLEAEVPEITEIMPVQSNLDITSLVASLPPRSPKRGAAGKIHYYLHSPSWDSAHQGGSGGYRSSSRQATPAISNPSDSGRSLLCNIMLSLLILFLAITCICLGIWVVERPYMPDVMVKTISINNFYASEGTDHSGLSTKMVTVNCSLNIIVYNPASMFGIHVTPGPVLLIYSDIVIGVGQVRKYYQPRNSHHGMAAVIHGQKVPLYGARGGQDLSSDDGLVPLTLDFELISRGYIISQLMWVTHKVQVTCNITVDAKARRLIRIPKDACAVYKA